jgi:tRNA-uridine 2-sulfurtransferase
VTVLVALSGGVDSSVAAALLVEAGHDVVGVTLKLWGGESDSGCCSVSDVDDARAVARQLGIDHHVFNFADDFQARVVDPYVAGHAAGATPNPCIECNRHLKFDRLLARADQLGFDQVATGHHARIVSLDDGSLRVARGLDRAKDQSYVLHMLGPAQLRRLQFPVGALTKDEVRARAAALGLRTAAKPDSQDVCFIHSDGGRRTFLGDRIALHPGRVVDGEGAPLGTVSAVELVTVGQRKGLGLGGGDDRRYVLDVDVPGRTVVVGDHRETLVEQVTLAELVWAGEADPGPLEAQCSAHGRTRPCTVHGRVVHWHQPQPRVARGQSVVLYRGEVVVGGGVVS